MARASLGGDPDSDSDDDFCGLIGGEEERRLRTGDGLLRLRDGGGLRGEEERLCTDGGDGRRLLGGGDTDGKALVGGGEGLRRGDTDSELELLLAGGRSLRRSLGTNGDGVLRRTGLL